MKKFFIASFALVAALALTSCDGEKKTTDGQTTEEAVEVIVDNAEQSVEDASEQVAEGAEKAADEVKEAADKVSEDLQAK